MKVTLRDEGTKYPREVKLYVQMRERNGSPPPQLCKGGEIVMPNTVSLLVTTIAPNGKGTPPSLPSRTRGLCEIFLIVTPTKPKGADRAKQTSKY